MKQTVILAFILANIFASASISFPIEKSNVANLNKGKHRFLDQTYLTSQNPRNNAYFLKLKFGKSQKELNLQLDTGSYKVWFVSEQCQGITEENYPNRYNCVAEDQCQLTDRDAEQSFGDDTYIKGKVAILHMTLPNAITLNYYAIYVTEAKVPTNVGEDGIIGIGPIDDNIEDKKNWINALFNANLITKNQFSMYLNFSDDEANNPSQLILGDIDPKYSKNSNPQSFNTHPVTTDYHWSVELTQITFGNSIVNLDQNVVSIIDSGTSALGFTEDILNQLIKNVKDFDGEYNQEQGMIANNCVKKFPTFNFVIKDINQKLVTYTLEPEFYTYQILDKNGGNICFFSISSIPGNQVLLGDYFMRKYYSTFSYDPLQITMTESITKPKNIQWGDRKPIPIKPINKDTNDNDKLWIKIVAPIISVLLLAVIIFFIVKYYKKRRANKQSQLSLSNASESTINQPLKQ